MTNRTAALLTGLATVAGCGMPRDPESTFERAQGGEVRVGATESLPWVSLREQEPEGIEVALVRGFAHQIDATVHWRRGSETELFEALGRAELALVIGGLKGSTPWSKQVALTQPYLEVRGDKHVFAVRQGENRWLLELDRYLQAHRKTVRLRYGAEARP